MGVDGDQVPGLREPAREGDGCAVESHEGEEDFLFLQYSVHIGCLSATGCLIGNAD